MDETKKRIFWYGFPSYGETICIKFVPLNIKLDSPHLLGKTEPLPAKAGRFDLLLKQPEVVRALLYAFVL